MFDQQVFPPPRGGKHDPPISRAQLLGIILKQVSCRESCCSPTSHGLYNSGLTFRYYCNGNDFLPYFAVGGRKSNDFRDKNISLSSNHPFECASDASETKLIKHQPPTGGISLCFVAPDSFRYIRGIKVYVLSPRLLSSVSNR